MTRQSARAGIHKGHALPRPGEGYVVLRWRGDARRIGRAQVLRQRPIGEDKDPTVGAALALPEVHRRHSVAGLPPVMPEHGRGKLLQLRGHIPWSDEEDAIVPGDLAIA